MLKLEDRPKRAWVDTTCALFGPLEEKHHSFSDLEPGEIGI